MVAGRRARRSSSRRAPTPRRRGCSDPDGSQLDLRRGASPTTPRTSRTGSTCRRTSRARSLTLYDRQRVRREGLLRRRDLAGGGARDRARSRTARNLEPPHGDRPRRRSAGRSSCASRTRKPDDGWGGWLSHLTLTMRLDAVDPLVRVLYEGSSPWSGPFPRGPAPLGSDRDSPEGEPALELRPRSGARAPICAFRRSSRSLSRCCAAGGDERVEGAALVVVDPVDGLARPRRGRRTPRTGCGRRSRRPRSRWRRR